MSTFVFIYRAPPNYQFGSAETMAAWQSWFADLGAHVIDVGNPVFQRTTLGDCAGRTNLGGYSIIDADDLQAATALAEGCPFLRVGGGVEVGEMTQLNPDSVTSTIDDHARATLARS